MKIKIEVTQDDIQNGEKGAGSFCPIARAVKRMLGSTIYVRVNRHDLVTDYNEHFHANLPETAQSFIQAFDAGHMVAPFDFEVEVNDLTFLRND